MKPIINNIKWDRIWIHFYISNLPSNSSVYISSLDGKYIHPLKVTEDNPHIYLLNITNPGNCKMLPTGIFKLVYKGNEPNDNFISIDVSFERICCMFFRRCSGVKSSISIIS